MLRTTIKSKSNQGFALPMTIMTGLILTVVGLSIGLKAMGDKNSAEATVQNSNSEALAEAGIARGLDELLRNKQIIKNTQSEACGESDSSEDLVVSLIATDDLAVSFSRPGTNRGRLESTGRYKSAASRIRVEFPINQTAEVDRDKFPALWAENITGQGQVFGNINVAGDCGTIASGLGGNAVPVANPFMDLPSGNRTPELSTVAGKVFSAQPLPSLPEFSLPENYNSVYGCGRRDGTVVLPRVSDNPAWPYVLADDSCQVEFSPGSYEVYVDRDLSLRGNETFGDANVILHVNGDIDIRGTSRLGEYNSTVLVYGERNISHRGTGDFYGHVFGPESAYDNSGTAKLAGALWVKDANLGNNSQGKVFQNISPSMQALAGTGATGLPLGEKIAPVSSYMSLPVIE